MQNGWKNKLRRFMATGSHKLRLAIWSLLLGSEDPEPGDLEAIEAGRKEFKRGNFVTLEEFLNDDP
jgi:hypothetical protein